MSFGSLSANSLTEHDAFRSDYGYDAEDLDDDLDDDMLVGSIHSQSSLLMGSNGPKSTSKNDKSIISGQQSQNGQVKPRILLMGLRRSGKSSIQKVVFQKMSPHETLFLESTNKIVKNDVNNNSFIQFQIWDFPGQINFIDSTFDGSLIFGGCGALLFVIDAQDDYDEAITKLNQTVQEAYKVNKNIVFEVFVHKVDSINDDDKIEIQRDIQNRLSEELEENGLSHLQIRYHTTSIYDNTIFEAFSKVIQKLIPQLPTLENLLDMLRDSSRIEKAFLFDVVSKIYIATDSSAVDNSTYELCSDMIDVAIDISCIYGGDEDSKKGGESFEYDEESSAVIHLDNGNNKTVLYMREVNKYLALVCLIQKDSFDKIGLINYNFTCFKNAIGKVFNVGNKPKKENSSS